MEKQKRWQLWVIVAVLTLTVYNILPTVFYYSKPLKESIDAPRAENIALAAMDRVNSLEGEAEEWLASFTKGLGITPTSIAIKPDEPRLIEVTFANAQEAQLFKRFLPRAGALIPFVPAQLELAQETGQTSPEQVLVVRNIDVHLNPTEVQRLFHFSPKYDSEGQIAELYRDIVDDRATHIALAFGGASMPALQVTSIAQGAETPQADDIATTLAKSIVDVTKTFGKRNPITKRYYASFSQVDSTERSSQIDQLVTRFEKVKANIEKEREPLAKEKKPDTIQRQQLARLDGEKQALTKAIAIVKENLSAFKAGKKPLTVVEAEAEIVKTAKTMDPKDPRQLITLGGRHPLVETVAIDWSNDKVEVHFYSDIDKIRLGEARTEDATFLQERLRQFLINDIAQASRRADETIAPDGEGYSVALNTLINMQSFMTFDLSYLAEKEAQQTNDILATNWIPSHKDLVAENYPVMRYEAFQKLPKEQQKLGLVIYAPAVQKQSPPAGFRMDSVYVIARGLNAILEKHRETPDAAEGGIFLENINSLGVILQKDGFIGYSGASYGMDPAFKDDFIFELEDYYTPIINATRENFSVKGSKRRAVLDFTNVEQRILTTNEIEDNIQQDVLKWDEEYSSAQVDPDPAKKYLIPQPTKSPFWGNLKLSAVKYYRGDERKILKWGLDLSGGKTVRIGLRDHNNRPVTEPADLKQAMNELYTRINKMGVSERTIRIENDNIILEFPGSQELSARDLIKASAMHFHIVNEKFSMVNPTLHRDVNQFLQEVWNEAVVTNRKDATSVNEIAWMHLGGDVSSGEVHPRTELALGLYDRGLRLARPRDAVSSHAFNDTLSSIAVLRGDDFSEWQGQTHPLMVVFHNYALEGANLTDVRVGYDPSEGNTLSFRVKGSYEGSQQGSPRDDFYAWTSQFSEDRIQGTPKEDYSQGRGWRMAVVLNNTVISNPALRAALRDGGMISGRFSQREVSQLAADLKAGSLTFTPYILSEQNISPELGLEERSRGIYASVIALLLVFGAMIGYYRFAGLVASCAVFLNILIMWGVLQNLGAAITLPGIAGIVLTIGMAVDANVLVFERIREEFKISGRIGSAIQAGYSKAFSAIVDSNVTTIIAATILTQFDSGPVKGFAITLIIGIVASMFTALFLTRYFFAGWVQNPKHTHLTMSEWIGKTKFNFMGQAKKAFAVSLIVMIAGSYLFVEQRNTIFGMDFTGGYSLTVELNEVPGKDDYRVEAGEALLAHGATTNDFQIRELSKPNQLQIQLGVGMEEKGHPFYQMAESADGEQVAYEYETNPRMKWVVDTLDSAGLKVQQSDLENLHRNWTVMSGQFSDNMRNNALMALGMALLSILIYITFRFEFKYAIAAVIGLAHDVVITLGVVALFHQLGFPVQINLEVIGAIMTIIGYSLNDTIVIFDRIREDLLVHRKMSFHDVINHALNITLGRTMMTSITTLLVLLALVVLGGWSIFGFSLVMTIGVLVGTLSSLFIAGPVMLFFHNREIAHKKDAAPSHG